MNNLIEDGMPLFRSSPSSKPTSPKQLNISRCSVERAIELNQIWHSRLPIIKGACLSTWVCFVAEYEEIAYAIAIWSNPIARMLNGKGLFELRRMAISPEAPKNTASRMLSVMRKHIKSEMPDILKLISYQDTEVHSGTIYKASGWVAVNTSKNQSRWDKGRMRNPIQTAAPKIRWEFKLRSGANALDAEDFSSGQKTEKDSFIQTEIFDAINTNQK